jgi:hypothetical protein
MTRAATEAAAAASAAAEYAVLHHREMARQFGQLFRSGPQGVTATPPPSFDDVDLGVMESMSKANPKLFYGSPGNPESWAEWSGRCGLVERYHAKQAAAYDRKVRAR